MQQLHQKPHQNQNQSIVVDDDGIDDDDDDDDDEGGGSAIAHQWYGIPGDDDVRSLLIEDDKPHQNRSE